MRFFVALVALASASLAIAQSSSGSAAASSKSAAISSGASSGSAAGASASAIAGSALSTCAIACITAAANATECGIASNITCACTNADFQFKAHSCLQAECQASEMAAALGLQSQECGAVTLSATALPTATAPFTPSNSAADISGSPSASGSGNTGSAVPLLANANAVFVALVAAALGGVVGGLLV
ncbi:hypothetical protein B0H13DRAFT_1979721 [Mycena leptocephala]|nr:hypothetical protein B0H13DRAFT_1979721 [Mycena leptocephala]